MIPKIAYFFWGEGTPFSFLRLITLRSFRKFHPDWQMIMYVGKPTRGYRIWSTRDRQDFMKSQGIKDYSKEWESLGIEVKYFQKEMAVAPNFLSDFFRWEILQTGGWYLDVDQLICKPFDDLLSYDFIFGCKSLCYVGVIGASTESKLPKIGLSEINKHYNPDDYCCIGPRFFIHLNTQHKEFCDQKKKEKVYHTENEIFYPISGSDGVSKLYSGTFEIPPKSYAVHWYGGHPLSQQFNASFTPEKAKTSNDTISRFVRREGLL